MIVITGATGALGSQAVEHLLTRVGAERLAVSVRDPARAAHLEARGVRVRRGDFRDPASLREAFEGAEQVLLVSANVLDEAPALHGAAIEAAREVGAQRIVYTSPPGGEPRLGVRRRPRPRGDGGAARRERARVDLPTQRLLRLHGAHAHR